MRQQIAQRDAIFAFYVGVGFIGKPIDVFTDRVIYINFALEYQVHQRKHCRINLGIAGQVVQNIAVRRTRRADAGLIVPHADIPKRVFQHDAPSAHNHQLSAGETLVNLCLQIGFYSGRFFNIQASAVRRERSGAEKNTARRNTPR